MAEEKEDDGKVTFKSTDVFSDSVTSRHFSYGEYRLDEATATRLQKAGKGQIIKEEKKSEAKASTSASSEKSNPKTANQKVAKTKGESTTGANKSLKSDEELEMEQNEGGEGSEGSESGNDITEQVNNTSLSGVHNQGSENTNEVNGAKETELPEKMPSRDELMKLGVDTVEKIETLGQKGLEDLKISKAKVTKIGLFMSEMKEKEEQK